MFHRHRLVFLSLIIIGFVVGCGGAQNSRPHFDSRALEEYKAIEIIAQTITAQGYQLESGYTAVLSNDVQIPCDLKATGQVFAIEYLTAQDRQALGALPPAAPGSRLHVIPATTLPATDTDSTAAAQAPESLYIFLLSDEDYKYQFNPTSKDRAQTTYHEVENRLIRDVKDFLSWYNSRPQ